MLKSVLNLARPAVRAAKRVARRFIPRTTPAPIPTPDRRAALEVVGRPALVEKAAAVTFTVRVRNLGGRAWSGLGTHPVGVRGRWVGPHGEDLSAPAVVPLPAPIYPGGELTVAVPILAPDCLGDFAVEFELEQESVGSFRLADPERARLVCLVTGRAETEIDYHDVYALADLQRDYWTVVGPPTREEFDRLSAVKRDMVIGLGLTPDSRVLDVGCGTGLLTKSLQEYLSDRGGYVGTDIGAEGIEFCRRQYTRPNFRFERNGMTTVPLTDERFDVVTFFSVFTHTYPDESALLLAEAKRLLAPGGFILADFFYSPVVVRHAGNRGAVEVNPEHMNRLIGLVGLKRELIDEGRWQRFGSRVFFRLTAA